MALNYYLGFIKKRADDASVRRDLADACIRTGDVYQDTYTGSDENLGTKQGIDMFVRGVALYDQLVRENPGERDMRVALAGGLDILARACWREGEHVASLDNENRAIQLWEQLLAEDPSNVKYGRMPGESYSWRALVKSKMGDEEGQTDDTRRAAQIFHRILANVPGDVATLAALAAAYRRSSHLDDQLEAVRISRQLIRLVNTGKATVPKRVSPLLQENVAVGREPVVLPNALNNAGVVYSEFLGQPGKGEPLLQECLDLRLRK